ncbi:MAG TPA: TonB-dependent receptor, partial [Bryobacteraceae bacterium]|nr:TonB-dependent receptor [Bryobacteraceae bacterium]
MNKAPGPVTRFVSTILLVLGFVSSAFAQSDTGVLFGVVSDPSARTIVGAAVTLKNNATGATREYITDERGVYFFTFLQPGSYTVQFKASGFKQYQDSSVRVQVAQVLRLDIDMQIGQAKEILEISGGAKVLTTDTAAQGTIIGQEKIAALPLNGRQFIQLALLVPGANPGGRAVQQNGIRQGQIGGLSLAGSRTNNTLFLLDGAMNTDMDYSTLNYSPSIDGIAEFQVQMAMVNAEYARSTVNVVTKSGGNEFHGSAFEFLRNRNFDARPFNLNQSKLPKYQRNQFGGTLGGPIVKEKLFTFFSYEGLRIRQAAPGLTSVLVPSAEQREGDFSRSTPAGIYDPLTLANGVRQLFPDNRIPANRMNPLAVAALLAVPLPTNPAASLFENTTGVLRSNNDNYSNRLDYTVSETWNSFGRYSISEEKSDIPATITGRDRINNARVQSAVLGSTKIFTSNLLNETRLSFSRTRILSGLPELSFDVNGRQQALPQFILAPYPIMGGSGAFNNTRGGGTIQVRNNNYQLYNNVAWHRGRHNFKFGGEALHVQYNRFESPSTLGDFQFTSGFTTRTARADGTGDALASFLLGLPAVASRAVGPSRIDGRQWSYSLYAQDDFSITPKLTMNLGVRYELSPPMYDQHQQMSSIDYSNVPSPGQIFAEGRTAFYKPTMFICGQSGTPRGCAYTDRNNFAPRVGLAYAANERTVIRSGFGMFYAGNDLNPLFRLAAGLPGNIAQTLNSDNFIPRFSDLDVFGAPVVGAAQIQAAGIDMNQRTSYSMQWNFSAQREVAKDVVVEAGYLANLGLKLEQNVQPNNALPGTGAVDPRRPYAALEFVQGTVFPSYLSVSGNSVPVGFINYLPHSAQSNYHAGLLRLEKRFNGSLSLLSS